MKNRWSDKEAASTIQVLSRQGVSLPLSHCIYASRLLGARKDLVLHGGGNTSVKTTAIDIVGRQVDAIFVKATGHSLHSITADGFTGLHLDRLRELEGVNILGDEQMLVALAQAKLDPRSSPPSVESLMHGFLSAPYIFHTHANAVLSVTNQPDGKKLANKAFGGEIIVLSYEMSGILLAKKVSLAVQRTPGAKAVVVLKHGIFSFGASAREAYDRMIWVVNLAEKYVNSGRCCN